MASRPNLPGFVRNRSQREWNPEPGSLGRKQGFMRTADGVMLEAGADSRGGRTLSSSIVSVGNQIASSDMSASELRSRAKAADVAAAVPPSRWLTHEGVVLQFSAQFSESVGDADSDATRVRDVVINYYLVDDTLEVIEKKQANSGLAQGTIIRRAQVPAAGAGGATGTGAGFGAPTGAIITWRDLVVGGTVAAYGIEYSVLDCNASTRNWLQQQGVEVAAAVPPKSDPYIEARAAERRTDAKQPRSPIKAYIEAALGNTTDLSTRQAFQDHGRTVLSFDAVWDASSLDARADNGAATIDPRDRMRRYVVNYYVATDQIEVLESHDGSGHDPFPSFLRAQKLPRPDADMCAPPFGRDDIAAAPAGERDFVHWRDLSIGGKVRVFGRDLVLITANASTRRFYEQNGGVAGEPARPLGPDLEVKTGAAAVPQKQYERAVPPPTGYGSEADSLASWKSVVPKPPKTAFELANGKLDPTIFKFTARMQSRRVEDKLRGFTVFYFFGDKTACIVEKPVRNSGFTGGTFLSRRAVKNGFTGEDLRPEEMFIGATLLLNCFTFVLTGADEGTLKYCEAHAARFPLSDAERVVGTLRDRLWSSADLGSLREGMDADDYLAALRELFPDTDEHALVTAARNVPPAELASKLA